MKNIWNLFFYFILLLQLSSCASFINQETSLNDNDYKNLEAYARKIINKLPNSRLTPSEKVFITKTTPQKIENYTGYKEGKISLVWELDNGGRIKYTAVGNLMDFKNSFTNVDIYKVSISNDIKE